MSKVSLSSTLIIYTLILLAVPSVASAVDLGGDTFFPFHDNKTTSKETKGELQALEERVKQIEQQAAEPDVDEEQLRLWLRELDGLKNSLSTFITMLEAQQNKVTKDLDTLGEALESEPENVAEQRKQMQQNKERIEGRLAGYRLLLLQSDELLQNLSEKRQQLLTQHFFARSPGIVELVTEQQALSTHWLADTRDYLVERNGLQLISEKQRLLMGGLAFVALLTGIGLRIRNRRWCELHHEGGFAYSKMLYGALTRYAPHILTTGVLALFTVATLGQRPYPFLYVALVPLPLLFLFRGFLYFLFRSECGIGALLGMGPKISRGFGRSFMLFAVLVYAGYLVFATEIVHLMPEPVRFFVRDIFVTGMVIILLWSSRYLHVALVQREQGGFFSIALLVLMGVLLAELLGYRNLSYWVLRALLGTVFVFSAFLLFSHLLNEFFEGLKKGYFWWQRLIRYLFGYGRDGVMPLLGWFKAVFMTALWLGFVYLMMFVFGISTDTMKVIYDSFFDGFQLGSLKVVPARIVMAIIVFAVIVAISSWIRRGMEGRWLKKSRMERGSREALVTITGYTGIALAIIFALGVAGVQFTNLAIIAGALSVGIGFGLQNIVNNFISGLILLFERPVKTGDWIMVGDTEGYVKRISIRSTQIQTFDRADVIVPNSELISSQVTNWMLYDTRGRIKVPVGVAYGSDTQKIKDILLDIANGHPSVINDGSLTVPKVLFVNFGDNALNFELRAYIQNIDERLQVVSDLNFAIEAAFREEGIEIPYPQRDLHIRDWNGKEAE